MANFWILRVRILIRAIGILFYIVATLRSSALLLLSGGFSVSDRLSIGHYFIRCKNIVFYSP